MSNLNKPEKLIFSSKPLQAQKKVEGYLLTDTELYSLAQNSFPGCGLFLMVIVLSFIGYWLAGIITSLVNTYIIYAPALFKYVILIFLGLLTVQTVWWFTIKSIYPLIKSFQEKRKGPLLGPGELLLSNYPVRIGEEYEFKFYRLPQRTVESQEDGTIEGYLIGIEMVSYTQGTDTMRQEVIFSEELLFKDSFIPSLETFTVEYAGKFRIPANLPPTFEGKNNQIRWVIAVKLNIPGVVIYKPGIYGPSLGLSNFTLIVDPEIVI